MNEKQNRIEFADSHNTSKEIVDVIFSMRKTQKGRERIWQNCSEKEFKHVCKKAFKNTDSDILEWGCQSVSREDFLIDAVV
jgi:hypothetical protein